MRTSGRQHFLRAFVKCYSVDQEIDRLDHIVLWYATLNGLASSAAGS
jgi:hypothetical protein